MKKFTHSFFEAETKIAFDWDSWNHRSDYADELIEFNKSLNSIEGLHVWKMSDVQNFQNYGQSEFYNRVSICFDWVKALPLDKIKDVIKKSKLFKFPKNHPEARSYKIQFEIYNDDNYTKTFASDGSKFV